MYLNQNQVLLYQSPFSREISRGSAFHFAQKSASDPGCGLTFPQNLFFKLFTIMDLEALHRKMAALVCSSTILSEYLFAQKELSDESNVILVQLKLDLAASHQFAWRFFHNDMLMRCSIALVNLPSTVPLIDENQKLYLLHVPFRGHILFGGVLTSLLCRQRTWNGSSPSHGCLLSPQFTLHSLQYPTLPKPTWVKV